MDKFGNRMQFRDFRRFFLSRKYSTALTSWLVVRSMVLMRSASSSLKSLTILSRKPFAWSAKAGTSLIAACAASFAASALLPDTKFQQTVFAEDPAQRADFIAVASIDRGNGGQ
ncbi:hypothetical protein CWS02_16180 [Enterobacter sp. EA-1]|nr:hypothetical protein CWS02_16180 [Enterobacter sp. EA-1]